MLGFQGKWECLGSIQQLVRTYHTALCTVLKYVQCKCNFNTAIYKKKRYEIQLLLKKLTGQNYVGKWDFKT